MRRRFLLNLFCCLVFPPLLVPASAQPSCDEDIEPPTVFVDRPVVTYALEDHWVRNWYYVVEECGISWTDNCSPQTGIVHGTNQLVSLSGEEIGGELGVWAGLGIAADWVGYGLVLDRNVAGPRDYLFTYAVIDQSWNWSYVECTVRVVDEFGDICDGIDNDEDGEIDEDFFAEGTNCGIGACAAQGQTACVNGVIVDTCDSGEPGTELCGTAIDEDCDGTVDEGFDVGVSCSSGMGACARSGTLVCTADGLGTECDAVPDEPQEELCGTEIDEDCDGEVDEGFDPDLPCPDPIEDCDDDRVPPQVTVGRPTATFDLGSSWVNYIRVEDACQLAWTDGCTISGDFIHGISALESLSGQEILGEPGGFYNGGIRAEWHTIDLNLDDSEVGPRAYLITYAVIDRAWNWSYVSCTIEIVGEAVVDGGMPDANAVDAGVPDAAPPDTATPDSGAQADGGAEDRTRFITFTRGQNFDEEINRITVTRGGEIWIVDPENPEGARAVVADPGASSLMSAWSPDKERLVFASNRGGDFTVDPSPFLELWVVDVASGDLTRILEAGEGHNWTPAWSPDGDLIALGSTRNRPDPDDVNKLDIWVVNADGTDPRMIYDGGGQDEDPVFSADGQTVYFMTGQTTGPCLFQIWQVDVDIGQPSAQPAVDEFGVPICGEDISASKDGQFLYYLVSAGPYRANLARWNIATRVNTIFNAIVEPCIGPSGTQVTHIYWIDGVQGGGHVLISNVDGSGLQYVTTGGQDFYPRW